MTWWIVGEPWAAAGLGCGDGDGDGKGSSGSSEGEEAVMAAGLHGTDE